MFKRTKNREETTKSAAPGKGGRHAANYFQALILPIVFVFILCGVALFYLQDDSKHQVVSNPDDLAAAIASRLSDNVTLYSAALQSYLGRTRVSRLFLDEDKASLLQHERALTGLLPGILRVRLMPAEWDSKDRYTDPPLSFASFDLLRQVEKSGRPSAAEVHQLGTAQQHVALAIPVVAADSRMVVGVLHAALPFNPIRDALQSIKQTSGSLEVQQLDAGKVAVLSGINNGAAKMAGVVPVAGSIWQVAYGSPVKQVDLMVQFLPLGILLVGALLIIPLILVQSRRLSRDLMSDAAAALTIVEEIKSGAGARPPGAEVFELQSVLELVRRVGSGPGGVAASKLPPAETPAIPPQDALGVDTSAGGSIATAGMPISPSIFRAYDIRGVVGDTLTEDAVFQLGQSIGSEAYDQGQQSVIIARDGRESGVPLGQSLVAGLMASGRDVIDIGMVPTPVLYFATHFLGANTGVMLTGSHNPPEYNGLKIVMAGEALSGGQISALGERIEQGNLLQGTGSKTEQDLLPDYINRIVGDVQLGRPLKVVADCGNGVAGIAVPILLQALGCEVIDLYCDVDGSFPNHHPDPGKPENLEDLIASVAQHGADIGVAFDGDGDRLGVVDGNGKIIWPDRLLMLLAQDVLSRQPGADIIYDVKSTRHLASSILSHGGRPIMWKTGHSLIKAKMRETGAQLAGEMSGHIFFKDRWYGFDDGIYSCARLLEILSLEMGQPIDVFAELPESISTPEMTLWFDQEGANAAMMEKIMALGEMDGAKLTTIDGLRADFSEGWGLVRPSNTTPALVFRFEADSDQALERIKSMFRDRLVQADPDVELPF